MEEQVPVAQVNEATSAPTGENVPPVKPESKVEEPKKVDELFELTVNGKTKKATKDELIRMAQLGSAATEKFETAAQKEKRIQTLLSKVKENPIDVLTDPALGLTKDQIRDVFEKWYLKEYIEPETLSPEQRRLKELEEKNAKYEEKERTEKERLEKTKQEEIAARDRDLAQKKIIDAMEKSNLPKSEYFVGRFAFYARKVLESGMVESFDEIPTDLLIEQVKSEHKKLNASVAENASVEQLIDLFGEGTVKKIAKYYVDQIKAKRPKIDESQDILAEQSKPKRPLTMREVEQNLRKIRAGVM